MENTPINLDSILEQARDWTFDGDFQILQWMNKLSQNLDARATKTTENLDRLNNNVKSTHVALDNVANSLTALQYGNQFVECRVQDDDETSMSGGNEGVITNGIAASTKPSSTEILSTFLDNNLKVLRNCHEKYSIDLDDSDEEEDEKTQKTYVFQPINPYNEKPLPHIFGSKEWCEKWHVGLSNDDQDNNYSGDEISEAYSESSSCSVAPDNDSYESNSEFASSVSLNNDNFASSNLERNVGTLRRSKVDTVSETSSSHSSAAKLSTHNPQSHDFIGEVHAASSSLSSLQSKTDDSFRKLDDSNAATSARKTTTSRANIPPYVDLFAEPPEDLGSTSSTPSLVEHILHKPVNIFNDEDDDVFKHLAIAQSKRTDPPVAKERTNVKAKSYPVEQKSIIPNTNVSDERKAAHSGFSVLPKHNLGDENQMRGETTSRTPKSLFDDEDDDEDFLSAFVKRQESFGNPQLLEKPAGLSNTFSNNRNKEDIFKDTRQDAKAKPQNEINDNQNRNTKEQSEPQIPKAQNSFINLFDDVEDEDLDIVIQKRSNIMQTSTKVIATSSDTRENYNTPTRSLANIMKSTNLFDDDDDDDDDFFKTLPSIRSSGPSHVVKKSKDELKPSSEVEGKIIKSSNLVVETESLYKHNPDVDIDSDFSKTSSDSSAPRQVVDNSKGKTSSGVLKESLKDDDEDDFFEKLQTTRRLIPTKTIDKIEDQYLPKKFNDLTPESRETTNQNANNILFDDTEIGSVLATAPSEILPKHQDCETQKESLTSNLKDLDLFNENSLVKSKNILEDDKDTSGGFVTSKPTKVVENILEDEQICVPNKTSNDLDTNKVCLAREIEENETSGTSEAVLKNRENQDSLITQNQESVIMNKGSKNEQNITHTDKTESERNSTSEDQKNKEDLMSNIENATEQIEQINIGDSLNNITQNKSTSLPGELLNVPTENTIHLSEEELNKTGADENFSKEEKKPHKYNLNSSFLFDEPPDDDDNQFFESLGKTSNQSVTKYNGFDLENDLYPEPQLPKIPNTEVSSSTYAGLQLFDDIPPDDDGFHEVMTPKPETTKRLNTVFYDDFHETLEALHGNQNQKPISTHSILNNEPPPDLDDDKPKFGRQNKDVVDFFKSAIKDEGEHESSTNTKDFDVHIKPNIEEEDNCKPYNRNRPISKLQLPNININVETLIPFGGGIPNRLKMMQNTKKSIEIEKNLSTPIVSNQSSDTGHILPNVNKTRVRAPLNRRPSTRKARQENYRKSLLEEELLGNDDDEHQENNKSNSELQKKPIHKTDEKSNMEIIGHLKPNNATQPSSKSHLVIDNVKAQPSTTSKEPMVISNPISNQNTPSFTDEEELHNTPQLMSNKKTVLAKDPKLFDEPDGDENDKTDIEKVITSKKSINTTAKDNAASLQSDQIYLDTTTNPSGSNETPQSFPKLLPSNKTEAGLLPQYTTKEKDKTSPLNITKSANELKSSTKMLFTDSESDDDLFSNFSSAKANAIAPLKRDNSNIVAAVKSLETRKAPTIKPQTSLFSDDSDEDDDFLKPTAKPKVVSKNTPKAAPQTKSIFSDVEDSDDGDLFGGNSKGNKLINKHTMKTTQSNAAEAKQSNKQTMADNPLADLL